MSIFSVFLSGWNHLWPLALPFLLSNRVEVSLFQKSSSSHPESIRPPHTQSWKLFHQSLTSKLDNSHNSNPCIWHILARKRIWHVCAAGRLNLKYLQYTYCLINFCIIWLRLEPARDYSRTLLRIVHLLPTIPQNYILHLSIYVLVNQKLSEKGPSIAH